MRIRHLCCFFFFKIFLDVRFSVFSFVCCSWMAVFLFWRFSFVEIALHGDSTTVEITSKNIIFLIGLIFNCFSFLLQKISWEGIRHLLSFSCKKKLVSWVFVI